MRAGGDFAVAALGTLACACLTLSPPPPRDYRPLATQADRWHPRVRIHFEEGAEGGAETVLSVFRTSELFHSVSTDEPAPELCVEVTRAGRNSSGEWLNLTCFTLGLVPVLLWHEASLEAVFRDASGAELCRARAEESSVTLVHLACIPLHPLFSSLPDEDAALARSVLRAAQQQGLFAREVAP
jgi:hypothetical protein